MPASHKRVFTEGEPSTGHRHRVARTFGHAPEPQDRQDMACKEVPCRAADSSAMKRSSSAEVPGASGSLTPQRIAELVHASATNAMLTTPWD